VWEGVQADRGWRVVADAGWFVGFLDAVFGAAAFEGAGAGAFAALRDPELGDVVEDLGMLVSPVLRGK
jgi:hypothetical protein